MTIDQANISKGAGNANKEIEVIIYQANINEGFDNTNKDMEVTINNANINKGVDNISKDTDVTTDQANTNKGVGDADKDTEVTIDQANIDICVDNTNKDTKVTINKTNVNKGVDNVNQGTEDIADKAGNEAPSLCAVSLITNCGMNSLCSCPSTKVGWDFQKYMLCTRNKMYGVCCQNSVAGPGGKNGYLFFDCNPNAAVSYVEQTLVPTITQQSENTVADNGNINNMMVEDDMNNKHDVDLEDVNNKAEKCATNNKAEKGDDNADKDDNKAEKGDNNADKDYADPVNETNFEANMFENMLTKNQMDS